jgi:hypothetical protein
MQFTKAHAKHSQFLVNRCWVTSRLPCSTPPVCDGWQNPPPQLIHSSYWRVQSNARSRSYFTTASQSVSMSWYLAPLWDMRPDITSCRSVAVWNLRSHFCEVPSLTRGRVCNLQCKHSMVLVAQNSKPYFTVSSETAPTWRARFPYLYLPGTGWPSYVPGHWVPFRSSLMTRRATVEVL